MSVPSHNLYDFVHQVTENRFWLLYFYPWGSKNLTDCMDKFLDLSSLDEPGGISSEDIIAVKFFHRDDIDWLRVRNFQPVLFCHDQEPLNYDLYADGSPAVECLKQEIDRNYNLGHLLVDQNIRCKAYLSHQKKWILLHSEKNSVELEKYESTGRYQGAFWWSHAIIALDWYRYAEYDLSLRNRRHKKHFLIYARAFDGTRSYRKKFLEQIDNISDHCQIGSHNKENITADHSAIYQVEDFVDTDISVVLETLFDDQRIHLTEKILRPIACGHPFILAAGPKSLDFLRSYGFETFSPWINENYDTELDHRQRLESIVTEMRRICSLDQNQKDRCIQECKEIALRNQRHFFSETFRQQIIQELQKNVNDAYAKCNNELDFDFYLRKKRWEDINHISRDKSSRSIMIPLIRHVRRHKGSFEQYQGHQHRLDDESSTDGHDV